MCRKIGKIYSKSRIRNAPIEIHHSEMMLTGLFDADIGTARPDVFRVDEHKLRWQVEVLSGDALMIFVVREVWLIRRYRRGVEVDVQLMGGGYGFS